jgi:hypothetical protein
MDICPGELSKSDHWGVLSLLGVAKIFSLFFFEREILNCDFFGLKFLFVFWGLKLFASGIFWKWGFDCNFLKTAFYCE